MDTLRDIAILLCAVFCVCLLAVVEVKLKKRRLEWLLHLALALVILALGGWMFGLMK
jgi:hypothetical protein